MVEDLRRLVEMETPSGDKARLDIAAEAITSYAKKIGGETEVLTHSKAGNRVLARFGWDKRQTEKVLLLTHFDTVWPVGTLKKIPFRVEGGRAYGPGAFDMKAGLVQGIWALRAIGDLYGFDRRVTLFCNSEEELGSPNATVEIKREAHGSGAVLVLEPSQNGKLKTSRKGAGTFNIKVTGKAAHAGLDLTKGVSAIDEMSRLVLSLHAMTDLKKGTTLNVGVIDGGTRSNVVPEEATAEVDIRVPTMREAKRVVPKIMALQRHHHDMRARVEIKGGIVHPPMERTRAVSELFERARGIAGQMGISLGEVSVGGASDGNFTAAMGIPTLDGLGAVGAGAHAKNEHVTIDAMPLRAALLARLIMEV